MNLRGLTKLADNFCLSTKIPEKPRGLRYFAKAMQVLFTPSQFSLCNRFDGEKVSTSKKLLKFRDLDGFTFFPYFSYL
jgi:hypothetical protein